MRTSDIGLRTSDFVLVIPKPAEPEPKRHDHSLQLRAVMPGLRQVLPVAKRIARRCPACAGLRLAIFVVTAWIGPGDVGTGDRGKETGEIFCQILARFRE